MNNDRLKKYVETKIALLQYEKTISGKSYYDIGLGCEEIRCNDALGSFEEGFECGRCQGELDALMMVYALMGKGEG